MQIKTFASIIGLTSALALSGAAYAQTNIGGVDYTDDDMTQINAYCAELAQAAGTTDASQSDDGDDANDGGADVSATSDESTLDLSAFTIEVCEENNLGTTM